MNPALLTMLTFLAAVLAVAALYSILSDLFLRDSWRISRRLDEEFLRRQRDRARNSVLFKTLGLTPTDVESEAEAENTLRQRWELILEQADLNLSVRQVVLFMAGGAVLLGGGMALFRLGLIPILLLGLVGAVAPLLYVKYRRQLRLEKMIAQLPDVFDTMARVIRAGQTITQAMQIVADEASPPVAGEFAYCTEQQNLGLPPEVTLRELAVRTGLLEIQIFVLALLVQQQTGGNLAEMLDKLAAVIRDRFRIRGKIKTLTAEGWYQALVLLSLPPLLFLAMLFLNRSYGQVLLDHPGLLIGTLVAEGLGALWINRIINFDF